MRRFYVVFILISSIVFVRIPKAKAQLISKYAPGMPELTNIIMAQNGGYYGLSDAQYKILLVRFDDQLNVVWAKTLSDSIGEKVNFFKQDSGSHLLFGGYRYLPNYPGFFLETDSLGDVLVNLGFADSLNISTAIYSSTGELYLFSAHRSPSVSIDNYIAPFKLDSAKTLIWAKKKILYPRRRTAFSAIAIGNTVYALCGGPDGSDAKFSLETIDNSGNWNVPYEWMINFQDITSPFLTVLPSGKIFLSESEQTTLSYVYLCILNGTTIVSQKAYKFNSQGLYYAKTCILKDGNIVMAGNVMTSFSSSPICICKIDNSLNIQWAFTLDDSIGVMVRDIAPSEDNGFVLLLRKGNTSELIKCDSMGNSLCQRTVFTGYNQTSFIAPQQLGPPFTYNEAVSFTSWNPIDSAFSYNLFDNCFGVNVSENFSEDNLELFPIPALDIISIKGLTFQSGNIFIQNMAGEILFNRSITGFNETINISGLKNGFYIVSIINQGNVFRKKILKLQF